MYPTISRKIEPANKITETNNPSELNLYIFAIKNTIIAILLKSIKQAESIYLENVNHRIIPLILNCLITILISIKILPPNEFVELYFFFIGVLLSTITCLILALISFKASIHMIASGGVLMFLAF